jgi:hypothetical protein
MYPASSSTGSTTYWYFLVGRRLHGARDCDDERVDARFEAIAQRYVANTDAIHPWLLTDSAIIGSTQNWTI